jgi:hypothetical protein
MGGTNDTADMSITMRSGDSFRLVTTDYAAFMEGTTSGPTEDAAWILGEFNDRSNPSQDITGWWPGLSNSNFMFDSTGSTTPNRTFFLGR